MHRGCRKFLRGVKLIRETVPDSCLCTKRVKIMKPLFDCAPSLHIQVFASHARVINPLINSSTDEWNNCRSLRDKSSWTLQFCAVLINKLTFVPLSIQDRTVSRQRFWPCTNPSGIEILHKRFPLLCHNFWLQGCAVADDIFWTSFRGVGWNYLRNFIYSG